MERIKKENMINRFLKIAMVIVFISIVVISSLIILLSNKSNDNQIQKEEVKTQEIIQVSRVKQRNDFFTVVNCVDRYITYLTTQEPEILYDYLDEAYRKEKGITKENVLNKLETLDDYYKFRAKEMYVTKLSDGLEQYFVYGILTLEATEEIEGEIKFYVSIKLDKQNNTFSVIPNQYIQNMEIIEE